MWLRAAVLASDLCQKQVEKFPGADASPLHDPAGRSCSTTAAVGSCNGASNDRFGDEEQEDGGSDDGGGVHSLEPPKIPGCTGKCEVNDKCPTSTGPTMLTGVVTIPAGTLPPYNARLSIPTGTAIPLASAERRSLRSVRHGAR